MFGRHTVTALFAAVIILFSGAAQALTFTPTELEWATWPEYCRVRYTVSDSGRTSDFRRYHSAAAVKRWQAQLGASWYALHHYCAGLIRVTRAEREQDPIRRQRGYEDAIKSFVYTIDRTPPEHFMIAQMRIQVGSAQWKLGKKAQAIRTLDSVIASHPDDPAAYFNKAKLLRGEKQLEAARQTLLKGHEATGGRSVELTYFLGLVSFELGDFDSAQTFAQQAYGAGYPLPGLKEKLASAGYPLQ